MNPSIEKLQKFFKLEAERGYDNKAVLGGLERMLDSWEAEARADELPEEIIQVVMNRLKDYYRLSEASRQEVLRGMWRRLTRELELEHPAVDIPDKAPVFPAQESPSSETPQSKPDSSVSSQSNAQIVSTVEEVPDSPSELAPEVKADKARKTHTIPTEAPAALDASITVVNGVGPRYAKTLERLGLFTLGDMLYHFPRRYDDYSKMKPINRLQYGEEVTVIGTVKSINARSTRSGKMKITEAIINDGTSSIRATWFNQPWITNRMKKGAYIVLSGKTDQYLGRLVMNNPEWEPIDQKNLHTNRIVPVYPLTAKITQRWLRYRMNQVVSYWAPRVQDPLPDYLIKDAELLDLSSALLQIHFPDSWEDLKVARHRLAFDEILLLQLGVLQQKQTWQERNARIFELPEESWLRDLIDQLPFNLTLAQQRALGDIRRDLASGHPMNRLIQGDVGSGKTIIAALGMTIITSLGSQTALMAPTSILAEQHYYSLLDLLVRQIGILKPNEIRLMIGATPDSEKTEIKNGLTSGEIKMLVGTHALIEDPVEYADLQLAVIDEQHRFGVKQRAALRSKGDNPHLLVITATPIPRSLALTVYGDLDLSIIDEMPPGRHPVDTYVLYPRERERAYALIDSQLEKDHQAFIIYPLIKESDKSDAKAAVEEHSRLQKDVFRDNKLGLLHGRLTPKEKEEVMAGFRDKFYNLLISTSVVEVGLDVPNATVMIIEGADRFGLAQLHQFRGRVGRGQAKSYCILIPQTDKSAKNERLKAMVDTNDGFILAERDLKQRGPGDFLGTRQAGFSELRFAKLTDMQLIEKARHHAKTVFDKDPKLEEPQHRMLAAALDDFWQEGSGDIS